MQEGGSSLYQWKGRKNHGRGSVLQKGFGQYRGELVRKGEYGEAVGGGECMEQGLKRWAHMIGPRGGPEGIKEALSLFLSSEKSNGSMKKVMGTHPPYGRSNNHEI